MFAFCLGHAWNGKNGPEPGRGRLPAGSQPARRIVALRQLSKIKGCEQAAECSIRHVAEERAGYDAELQPFGQ
jgi:hypothetical protein